MSQALNSAPTQSMIMLDPAIIENMVINGDLKRLSPAQKVAFYNYKCQQAGLDPAAKPFDLLVLNGKEILYANAGATQQLTANRNLSHAITSRELTDGIYCVFCRVTGPDGRSTENMGAVPMENLKGEAKANAMLKATTKAIRRSVLAHCGLGMMDESETVTIPGAQAQTWVEPSELPEWSDEDLASAKAMVSDMGQILMDAGLTEEAIAVVLDPANSRQMAALGDPEVTFEKWANRWAKWSSDQIAKQTKGIE